MFKFSSISRENQVEYMSEENTGTKFKVIGCRVTEDELQNFITPIMHDCYQLGIIKHDTISASVRFCLNFWIGHYRARKQEFEMRQQDIEQEKKKLARIAGRHS
jgi:hypothetical protein